MARWNRSRTGVHSPDVQRVLGGSTSTVLRGPRGKTGKRKKIEGFDSSTPRRLVGGTRVGLTLSPPSPSTPRLLGSRRRRPHRRRGPFFRRAESPTSLPVPCWECRSIVRKSIGFFFCRSIRFFLQRAASIPFGFKKDQERRPALEILPRSAAFDASFQDGPVLSVYW
uniref:Uncharacterized protein n=1 Tax=Setaria viridis TaxID=4556 RepID=A0A4U6SUU4_SETVI|nr:hypothetical protein SEVIR_9G121201v2 [Setaria viridis]